MKEFVLVNFPLNQGMKQHCGVLKDDASALLECALQASMILGIECSDVGYLGDVNITNKRHYYQIVPEPYEAKTKEEEAIFRAFIDYFSDNYGKKEGHCYFDSPYEAFYNLIKAWTVWNDILDIQVKQTYLTKFTS